VVSTDEIRKECTGTMKFNKELNNEIFDIAVLRIKEQLTMKNNVVFDATNTNKKNRKALIELGKIYNSKIIAIVMLTPLYVCLRRNKQRDDENRLSEEVLKNYNKSNLNINCSEGFDEVINIKYPY
jgi:predicted kinase